MKPYWITKAESYIGLKEISGAKNNTIIQTWLRKLGAWWSDDETPWCGVFVAECLNTKPKHWYRAKAWLDWGVPIDEPVYGCVVIFGREGGGHVGFVVGKDERGRLLVLGGNQGNKVSIAPFETSRVLGYRVPYGYKGRPLITMTSNDKSSTNEA